MIELAGADSVNFSVASTSIEYTLMRNKSERVVSNVRCADWKLFHCVYRPIRPNCKANDENQVNTPFNAYTLHIYLCPCAHARPNNTQPRERDKKSAQKNKGGWGILETVWIYIYIFRVVHQKQNEATATAATAAAAAAKYKKKQQINIYEI